MFYIRNCSGKATNRRKGKKGIGMETENKNPKKKAEAEANTIKKTKQEKRSQKQQVTETRVIQEANFFGFGAPSRGSKG